MIMAPTRLQERWLLQTADAGIRIVLADGDDPRAQEASLRLAEIGIASVLVTSRKGAPGEAVECLDPREPGDAVAAVVAEAVDRQASKRGLSDTECAALAVDPLIVGAAAVRAGQAHGCVAGATRASADVARAAIRVVGMAPGRRTLSSCFIMAMPDGRAFAYGDCAVVPEPDAEQLADIAIATGQSYSDLVGGIRSSRCFPSAPRAARITQA